MTGRSGPALSGGDQLRSLRERAAVLVATRVAPAASEVAAHAADPLRQVLGYLPLVVEHGGPILKALRRTAGRAEQAVAPRRRPAVVRFARPAAIAIAMLGAGYLAYRLAGSRRIAARPGTDRRSA